MIDQVVAEPIAAVNLSLAGKTALVTGASPALGEPLPWPWLRRGPCGHHLQHRDGPG